MSDDFKYHVLPKKVDPSPIPQVDSIPLNDGEKEDIKGLSGCQGLFLAAGACFAAYAMGTSAGLGSDRAVGLGLVAGAVIVAVLHLSIRGVKISEKERAKAQQAKQGVEYANKAEISRAEDEARRLTSDLLTTYESSAVVAPELPQHLSRAANWLQQAENEYRDSAFGPFWDAVENAAQQLAAFNGKANQVSKAADKYYGGLDGRTHTFPSFPANSGNLPNPTPVLNELRRVVRMGQTNFQFANIWEHRRTREVMIAGFRTLGEAVSNLGSTLESSLYGLEQSISSDVARSVQEQIKTRDSLDRRLLEQNRMLDNIQHHRKPRIGDRPSRY
jgi:hypothetical protein